MKSPRYRPDSTNRITVTSVREDACTITATSGVIVGAYHIGATVRVGADTRTNLPLNAPTFDGNHWKAERDGSIRIKPGRVSCEFVSPILKGGEGVEQSAVTRHEPKVIEIEPLLTEKQACAYLKTCKRNLYCWRMAGLIPYVKIGRAVRFRPAGVEYAIRNMSTRHHSQS
jgi:hypothetical protein